MVPPPTVCFTEIETSIGHTSVNPNDNENCCGNTREESMHNMTIRLPPHLGSGLPRTMNPTSPHCLSISCRAPSSVHFRCACALKSCIVKKDHLEDVKILLVEMDGPIPNAPTHLPL